jgi:solute carrier family 32 (vesicular inhibitory amino acid transporter)
MGVNFFLDWSIISLNLNPIHEYRKFYPGYPPIANLLAAYGVVAFQFDIHPMLLTIQVDMKNKRKIGKAVCIGILTTCCLSGLATSLAAYRYGQMTTSNLLETLPKSWILYLVIMLVTVQLCLSSAVGNSALYQHLENLLGVPQHFTYKRCLVRSAMVFLAVLIGELLPKFDLVMSLIGGSLNGTLIFIMPPLFYTKITRMERAIELERARREASSDDDYGPRKILNYGTLYSPARRKADCRPFNRHRASRSEKCCRGLRKLAVRFFNDVALSLAVVFFGLGASLASTYYNLRDVQNSQFWSPCLSNITASLDFIET